MGSTTKETEGAAWRKFLQPLLSGIIALITAITVSYQSPKVSTADNRIHKLETRVEVVETKMSTIDEMRDDLKQLNASMNQVIGILSVKQNNRK